MEMGFAVPFPRLAARAHGVADEVGDVGREDHFLLVHHGQGVPGHLPAARGRGHGQARGEGQEHAVGLGRHSGRGGPAPIGPVGHGCAGRGPALGGLGADVGQGGRLHGQRPGRGSRGGGRGLLAGRGGARGQHGQLARGPLRGHLGNGRDEAAQDGPGRVRHARAQARGRAQHGRGGGGEGGRDGPGQPGPAGGGLRHLPVAHLAHAAGVLGLQSFDPSPGCGPRRNLQPRGLAGRNPVLPHLGDSLGQV